MRKTKPYLLRSAALALTLLLPLAAQAAWYQIEIIVFSRPPVESDNPEHWPRDPGRPDFSQTHSLGPAGSGGYARLPQSALRLDGAYWSLRGSANLRPLVHVAWRQPITGKSRTIPVCLRGGNDSGLPELEGTLRSSNPLGPVRETTLGFSPETTDPDRTPIPVAPAPIGDYSYRMQAHRRMRSGELHYIDHPLMGVLLRVDRYRGNNEAKATEAEQESEAPPEEARQ